MIDLNTMKFGTDTFKFTKRGLFKALVPLDFSDCDEVLAISFTGTEPPNSERKIIFEIDGKLYRFVNGLDEYTWRPDVDEILKYGNTINEILAVEDFSSFVGKLVYPIFALQCPKSNDVYPKLGISAVCRGVNDYYEKVIESPIYDVAQIQKITADKTVTGNARINFWYRTDGGDWQGVNEANLTLDKSAEKIQLRTKYILSAIDGSDSAKLDKAVIYFSDNPELLTGNWQELTLSPQEYFSGVNTCYALVKHSELFDCNLQALVKFEKSLSFHENIYLGNGTGDIQILKLVDNGLPAKGVLQDTILLTIDGVPTDDFYFDTESGTITISQRGEIYVSYYDGLIDEDWRLMDKDYSRDGETRFIYRNDAADNSVSAVKFTMTGERLPVIKSFLVGWR